MIPAQPIGLLKMRDDKGQDDKVLCVAAMDPSYAHVHDLNDLPPHFLKEVEHFFATYKTLERKSVVAEGWLGQGEALAFVEACIETFG
jgi:inorganic pyrophosphatase